MDIRQSVEPQIVENSEYPLIQEIREMSWVCLVIAFYLISTCNIQWKFI